MCIAGRKGHLPHTQGAPAAFSPLTSIGPSNLIDHGTNREFYTCSGPRGPCAAPHASAGDRKVELAKSGKTHSDISRPLVRNKSCLPHRQGRILAITIARGSRMRAAQPRSSSNQNRKPREKRLPTLSLRANNCRASRASWLSHRPRPYAALRSKRPSAPSNRRCRRSRCRNSRASEPG